VRRPLSRSADPAALLLLCKPFSQRFHPLSGYSLSRGQGPQNFSTTSHHKMNLILDFYLHLCYIRHILAHSGRVLEPYLNTERGVASRGSGSGTVASGGRESRRRALRPGRKELAATEPNLPKRKLEAGSGERSAAPGAQNRHGESAERRASRVMGRKAPRTRLACAPMRTPHGCLASTRTSLGAPPPLKFGGSEAKVANPGRKNAPRERRSVVRCQLFQFVIPAEPR
jgi:hypothetical protein